MRRSWCLWGSFIVYFGRLFEFIFFHTTATGEAYDRLAAAWMGISDPFFPPSSVMSGRRDGRALMGVDIIVGWFQDFHLFFVTFVRLGLLGFDNALLLYPPLVNDIPLGLHGNS
jgi:hypothetical protein